MSPRTYIHSLRVVAFLEGLSLLALLGSMIYRSQTGEGEPVSWSGSIHGGLFILFALILFLTWQEAKWTLKFTILIGISTIIPFGFLFAEPFLKKKIHELTT